VRRILFSDLDGALLDPETYCYDPALPAVQALRDRGVPLVLCSGKTRAEMEHWRARLNNDAPFIVENGGAIYIPRGYFPFRPENAQARDGYDVIEFGVAYHELVESLRIASLESDCRTAGFHDMSVAEICLRTAVTVRQAELAKRREYDEPFDIIGSSAGRLLSAIKALGKTWTRGERFYHIHGGNDIGLAARRLAGLFARAYGPVLTIGVGNRNRDANLLGSADERVTVRSAGPRGWREAVEDLVSAEPAITC
jgi:mannosyl-3-phosphoglycerate phosphatase